MIIPKLDKSNRIREYNTYNDTQRAKVLYSFLFEGLTHRELDKYILGKDSAISKGWQSMGILHYLGLKAPFRGLFLKWDINDAISELQKIDNQDFKLIINLLKLNIESDFVIEDIKIESQSDYEVVVDGKQSVYYTTRYERNPKNRKMAIKIHGNKCMACGFDFESVYGKHGKNYIEVHHVVPLSYIGEEIKINPKTDLITLCSNCHRMVHRQRNKTLSLSELKQIINK